MLAVGSGSEPAENSRFSSVWIAASDTLVVVRLSTTPFTPEPRPIPEY